MRTVPLEEYLAGRALADFSEAELRHAIANAPISVPDMRVVEQELDRRLNAQRPPVRRVEIIGVSVPMGDLAALVFKVSIAAIPTAILWLVVAIMLRGALS